MFDTGFLLLHVAAAITWVGGMFFAHQVLRPAAISLAATERLALWVRVFERFFPWVWASIIALVLSGYAMVSGRLGGFAQVGLYVWIMQGLAFAMIAIFFWIYFHSFRTLRGANNTGQIDMGLAQLAVIRRLVGINIVLGFAAAMVGAAGRLL
jgi:uncharacterized membrane protein